MLRAAFWLTALVFLPVGLFLYFLPPTAATVLGVSPLWLARVAGGLIAAWGAFLLVGGARSDGTAVFALAAGNLLTVAALVPPALRLADTLPAPVRLGMLALAGLLTLLAVAGLLALPSGRSRI
ncbi:hypothetical protein V3W47_05495 [Deinococcus sp. YIM 134068]|uniref:hypothetical protein n=1 Tax=Deinococcus lichenicola TaxID=3118910 RepID=UPI002F934FB8